MRSHANIRKRLSGVSECIDASLVRISYRGMSNAVDVNSCVVARQRALAAFLNCAYKVPSIGVER